MFAKTYFQKEVNVQAFAKIVRPMLGYFQKPTTFEEQMDRDIKDLEVYIAESKKSDLKGEKKW